MRKSLLFTAGIVGVIIAIGYFAWLFNAPKESSPEPFPLAPPPSPVETDPVPGGEGPSPKAGPVALEVKAVSEVARKTAPQKTFEDRIMERIEIIDKAVSEMSALPSNDVLASLIKTLRGGDDLLLNVAGKELVSRVHNGDDEPVELMKAALMDLPAREQAYLVLILGRMVSGAALEALLDIAMSSDVERRARWQALDAISRIGKKISGLNKEQSDREHIHETLSSILEARFAAAPIGEPDLIVAIASGLSTVGTAEGVEKLISFLESQDASPQTAEGKVAAGVATALKKVRNPAAAAPLKRRLRLDPQLSRNTTRIAGDALAAMGQPGATEALLRWATGVEGEKMVNQALAWFSRIRDERSLSLLLEYVGAGPRSLSFRDSEMQTRLGNLGQQIDRAARPVLVEGQ